MPGTMLLFDRNVFSGINALLLAGILAGSSSAFPVHAQSPAQAPAGNTAVAAGTPSRYQPNRFAGRAGRYYALFWGIDSLSVKAVESGELIRFSWRVLDADKAKTLSDKKFDAFLIAPDQHIRLSIPSLENVGQLRQSSTPEAGKSYWMAFSDPGRRVKRGDRVNVVIGQFHAEGLVVE